MPCRSWLPARAWRTPRPPPLAKDAEPIEGLLALDVFDGRTVTLDFAGGALYVESPESAARRIEGARELPVRVSREAQGLALAVNLEVPTVQGTVPTPTGRSGLASRSPTASWPRASHSPLK